MEVIPAIDLLGGRCVRLYQGDFAKVTEYSGAPLDLARAYADAGMKRLHVVDLDGARDGVPGNLDLITAMANGLGMQIQAGGGIRSLSQVRSMLDAGAARVVIGSVAVNNPELVADWMQDVGPGRVILAFDVRLQPDGEPIVTTHGWTRASSRSLWEMLAAFPGADEVLCTDIAKDGTLQGPNLELYRQCATRFPTLRFIASGGVSCAVDLPQLAGTGAAGVVTGKALLDGKLSLGEITQFLQNA